MKNKKVIIICGPTATGKTKLAISFAKKINGELVSADSRQIYQEMNIGTGKDLPENSKFIRQLADQISNKIQNPNKEKYKIGYYLIKKTPLWLYDIIQPNQSFSSFEYAKIARAVIVNIQQRNKTPIVVGGTGFYIKTLIDGLDTEGIKPDWELRKELSNLDPACRQAGIEKLRKMLQALDPDKLKKMNNSDRNNPRRLIRAIEIVKHDIRYSKLDIRGKKLLYPISIIQYHNIVFIGLTASKETLYQQIDERVDKRIDQGIIKEVRNLLNKGYKWSDPSMNCLGYKEWQPYFENKKTLEEVIVRWRLNEHSFAKRQLTWFRKDKRIKWFDIEKTSKKDILMYVLKVLK